MEIGSTGSPRVGKAGPGRVIGRDSGHGCANEGEGTGDGVGEGLAAGEEGGNRAAEPIASVE